MLSKRIKDDYMTSFKNRDIVSKNLLSVIKGEIQTQEKNLGVPELSDDDVVKILNKMLKSLKENLTSSVDNDLNYEISIIEGYLPKQMSDSEIRDKINDLMKNDKVQNIAEVMREFSKLPVDRKKVSEIYLSMK